MKSLVLLTAELGTGASAFGQAAVPANLPLRTRTSFDLTVHAALAETMPLFGPEGERGWAGRHWNPKFIYPQPAHDEQGAVFTVNHGPFTAVWVITQFDPEARHFQYAYFVAGIMVTTIDVRFAPVDSQTTLVNVVYVRTAITPEGNEHVETMTAGDRNAGQEWQEAIDAYLKARTTGTRP